MKIKLQKSKVPKGYNWTIEETNDTKLFDPKSLKLHFEPEQKESYIEGNKLRKRMKGKGMSANVLDYLIGHPKLIPEDWKEDDKGNTRYIYFWGTVYRDSDGDLYVRFVFWGGGGWVSGCDWLGGGWRGGHPAAVSSEVSNMVTKPSSETLNLDLVTKKEWIKRNEEVIERNETIIKEAQVQIDFAKKILPIIKNL